MAKLMLLGLLKQKNLTGYEIKQYLKLSHAESWAGIKTGSIYYALKKMEENNLIKIKSIENTGNRSRTIYSITKKGENYLEKELESTLKKADLNFPSSLYTSLTFLKELPYKKAIKAIDTHIKKLEAELKNWESDKNLKEKINNKPIPDYMKALFKNGSRHIKANIDFLKEIKALIPNEPFDIELPPLKNIKKGD